MHIIFDPKFYKFIGSSYQLFKDQKASEKVTRTKISI